MSVSNVVSCGHGVHQFRFLQAAGQEHGRCSNGWALTGASDPLYCELFNPTGIVCGLRDVSIHVALAKGVKCHSR
jgi:hypothetical protein